MRILILNSILYTPSPTHSGRVITTVNSIEDCMIVKTALEFVKHGHEVTLVAAEEYKPTSEQTFPFEIVYFRSSMPKIFLPTVLPLHSQLISFIKQRRDGFDMIISSEVFSFNSLFAAWIVPDKTILWNESGDHNRKFCKLPSLIWYNVVARLFMRKVKVVPRSTIAQKFIKRFGLNVSDSVIDHGVDGGLFHFQREKKASFVVVARLDKNKNVMSIIKTYKKFIERYPYTHYSLYIIGDGDEYNNLNEYVNSNNLNNLFFLGKLPQRELRKYLADSVCLLINSMKELNMISIGEAIVSGTPILTNTVPYSHETVAENKLGIAKDNWTEEDMYEIVRNNQFYVDNCSKYYSQLLLSTLPERFIQQLNTKQL